MSLCPSLPTLPTCSGTGTCIGLNTCTCPDGWIGQSDMTWGAPSCSVYVPAIQALYAIEVLCTLGTQCPVAMFAFWAKRSKGRSLRIQAPHLVAMLNGMCLGVGGILRCVRPQATIGTDLAVTIVWAVSWTLAVTYGYFFTSTFLGMSNKLMGHTPTLRRKIDQFVVAFPYSLALIFLTAPMIFLIMLGFKDSPDSFLQLSQTFWLGNGIAVFVFFEVVVVLAFNPIVKELSTVLNHSSQIGASHDGLKELAKTLKKVKYLRMVFGGQGVMVGILGCLFAFVPLLNRAGGGYEQALIMQSWAVVVLAFEAALLTTKELDEYFPAPFRWLLSFGANEQDYDTTAASDSSSQKGGASVSHRSGAVGVMVAGGSGTAT